MTRDSYSAGARIELRYGKHYRRWVGRHGQIGTVQILPAFSGGPINYGVLLDTGELVAVSRRNIRPYKPSPLFGEGW